MTRESQTPRTSIVLAVALLAAAVPATLIAPAAPAQTGGGGGPDLVVRNLSTNATQIEAGETVHFTYELANEGDEASDDFVVTRSFTGENTTSGGGFIHFPMEAGEVEHRSFEWTADAGDWTVNVTADASDWVNETDETNNWDETEVSVADAKDLAIRDVALEPAEPVPGERVWVNYTLVNEGSQATGEFDVSECKEHDGLTSCGLENHPGLNASESERRSFSWVPEEGEYNVSLEADSGDDVNESEETDNVRTLSFVAASAPDIVAYALQVEPTNLTDGDDVVFHTSLLNQGNDDTGSFHLALDLTDRETGETSTIANVSVESLAAGESRTVNVSSWEAQAGNWSVTARADVANEVDETSETNNTETETFLVNETSKPNLVGLVYVDPHRPVVGQDVDAEVSIHNVGDADAGPFDVVFETDGEAVRSVRVAGLDAGDSVQGDVFIGSFEEPGTHRVTMVLDADGEVDETDETDNEASVTFEVVLPPDPAVTALDVTKERVRTDPATGPANPVAGQEVEVSVGDLGEGQPQRFVELTVEACPAEPALHTPLAAEDCQRIEHEFLSPEEVERGTVVEATWDTLGRAGDWEICATLDARQPQVDPTNDERCQETFVAVGGTGLGAVDVRDGPT